MPVSPDDFRQGLARFASGITVVTTRDAANRFHGITVSAFCSVSLDPPQILICLEETAGSNSALVESGVFVVNILSSAQEEISERFAAQIDNKFESIEFSTSESGVPILSGCIANLECTVAHRYHGGDHTIFVGQVENAFIHAGDPLIYFQSGYHAL